MTTAPGASESLGERAAALRADPGVATLEGFHALKHALRFGARIELALTADPAALDTLAAALAPDVHGRIHALARPAPRELVGAGSRGVAPDVVAFARRPGPHLPEVLAARRDRPLVALENPRHLGNVGAVIRVAAACDAAGVLTTGSRDPWDPAAIRGSAGLHFALPVLAVAELATGGRPLVAIDPAGDSILGVELPPGAVLAFGSERHGLSRATRERADLSVGIPMRAGVSSLNLATAVAVILFTCGAATANRPAPR